MLSSRIACSCSPLLHLQLQPEDVSSNAPLCSASSRITQLIFAPVSSADNTSRLLVAMTCDNRRDHGEAKPVIQSWLLPFELGYYRAEISKAFSPLDGKRKDGVEASQDDLPMEWSLQLDADSILRAGELLRTESPVKQEESNLASLGATSAIMLDILPSQITGLLYVLLLDRQQRRVMTSLNTYVSSRLYQGFTDTSWLSTECTPGKLCNDRQTMYNESSRVGKVSFVQNAIPAQFSS